MQRVKIRYNQPSSKARIGHL